VRRAAREVGWGTPTVLDAGTPEVLALAVTHDASTVLTLHNLGDSPRTVPLDFVPGGHVTELLSNRRYETRATAGRPVELDAYGYRWFRTGNERRWGSRTPADLRGTTDALRGTADPRATASPRTLPSARTSGRSAGA
jgi:hypothetical protein